MAKLTSEHIKCINDILIMMGIEFMDIRYEMVDHIASVLEEKEGDFRENLKKYLITHKVQLLNQHERMKKTARTRAIKYYLKTLTMPVSLAVFTVTFAVIYFYARYFFHRSDLTSYGCIVLLCLIFPFALVSWNNKKISIMRFMVQLLSYMNMTYMLVMFLFSLQEDKAARMLTQRFCIATMAGLLMVLGVSIYNCSKQFKGKYI